VVAEYGDPYESEGEGSEARSNRMRAQANGYLSSGTTEGHRFHRKVHEFTGAAPHVGRYAKISEAAQSSGPGLSLISVSEDGFINRIVQLYEDVARVSLRTTTKPSLLVVAET
jgi:hypothetical protein